MPKNPLPPLQFPPGAQLPRTLRETYAQALLAAETTYRETQAALARDDSNQNRARYARALYEYDRLQATFPFIAAGRGDAQA